MRIQILTNFQLYDIFLLLACEYITCVGTDDKTDFSDLLDL